MSLGLTESDNIGLIISAVSKFGFSELVVRGESMRPLLSGGTRVKIVQKRFAEIRPHDWVAFTRGDKFIVHEVLFVARNHLISWGVNNSWTDGVVFPNQVVGIVEKKQIWRSWHLVFLAEARVILEDFKKAGVRNLILKGPVWQMAKYGYLLDKPSADIDWLVDRADYVRVRKILIGRGYRLKRLAWMKKEIYQGAVPRASEMTYVKRIYGREVSIDLHLQAVREALTAWYKEPITRENMNRLTDHLLGVRVWRRGWPVLPDSENLFYLCFNLMIHHGGRGIYQLANIARAVQSKKVDWGEVTSLARNYRVESYIYFPLLWSQRLFKVRVPILNQICPSPVRLWLAKLVVNRWTIMKPIPVSRWLGSSINLLIIGYLRIVLSAWKKSH